MTKIEFINQLNLACDAALAKGARFNKAVVFAQAALESHWGNSELAQQANNLFSTKAGASWQGETISLKAKEWDSRSGWYAITTHWRKYADWSEALLDYARIIAQVPWYQDALKFLNNPRQFLKALLPEGSEPGWATDPDYFQKVEDVALSLEEYGGPKWV